MTDIKYRSDVHAIAVSAKSGESAKEMPKTEEQEGNVWYRRRGDIRGK
jgi:hypothetical protein